MTKEKYVEICQYLRDLIKGTEFENHLYAVGGCCRDFIMDNPIKDIDLVLDIENGGIDFAKWLEDNHFTKGSVVTYPTYGTAMVHLSKYPDVELEFVHTRKEQYKNKNSRNPETEYGTIQEDALRRDLTINALYFNISTEELLDPTNKGLSDIEKHVLRVTSTPDIVFTDDPLRILRCIRFQGRYGWPIDTDTFDGMKNNVDRLSIITQERITDEFNKMMMGNNPVNSIHFIKEIGALKYVLPELEQTIGLEQTKHHFGDVYQHTMAVLEHTSTEKYLPLQLAALLHDIGKIRTKTVDENGNVHFLKHELVGSDMTEGILRRMKYSNETIKEVRFLVKNHMRTKQWEDDCSHMKGKTLRKLQYECKNHDTFTKLMNLIDADNNAHSEAYCLRKQVYLIKLKTVAMVLNKEAMFDYKLPVNGSDIMEYKNIRPGKEVKAYMDYLLKIAFNNPKITKEECLKHIKNVNF